MAKKKEVSKDVTINKIAEVEDCLKVSLEFVAKINVSEMTIIEIMHQKNISREDAINFLFINSIKQ